MAAARRFLLRPGRQPWDPANGLRVGIMVGGLIGAAVIALTGLERFWILAATGTIGGAVGYCSEKRKQRDRCLDSHPCRHLDP